MGFGPAFAAALVLCGPRSRSRRHNHSLRPALACASRQPSASGRVAVADRRTAPHARPPRAHWHFPAVASPWLVPETLASSLASTAPRSCSGTQVSRTTGPTASACGVGAVPPPHGPPPHATAEGPDVRERDPATHRKRARARWVSAPFGTVMQDRPAATVLASCAPGRLTLLPGPGTSRRYLQCCRDSTGPATQDPRCWQPPKITQLVPTPTGLVMSPARLLPGPQGQPGRCHANPCRILHASPRQCGSHLRFSWRQLGARGKRGMGATARDEPDGHHSERWLGGRPAGELVRASPRPCYDAPRHLSGFAG